MTDVIAAAQRLRKTRGCMALAKTFAGRLKECPGALEDSNEFEVNAFVQMKLNNSSDDMFNAKLSYLVRDAFPQLLESILLDLVRQEREQAQELVISAAKTACL